ncbi:putative vacuolar protein 8 [Paratrimastix pyriformis]|uniref:Vacuolar protein 8 n=1 Tax=Paratrimastix pyriformis TaxID=342808 RepID=A0ABQ8UMI9_9EUKA|nr:putative vacuolar protein 8 [Paratrimastix pyriformis]
MQAEKCSLCKEDSAKFVIQFYGNSRCPHRMCINHSKKIMALCADGLTACPICSVAAAVPPGSSFHQTLKQKVEALDKEYQNLTQQIDVQTHAYEGLKEELARQEALLETIKRRREAVEFTKQCTMASFDGTLVEEATAKLEDLAAQGLPIVRRSVRPQASQAPSLCKAPHGARPLVHAADQQPIICPATDQRDFRSAADHLLCDLSLGRRGGASGRVGLRGGGGCSVDALLWFLGRAASTPEERMAEVLRRFLGVVSQDRADLDSPQLPWRDVCEQLVALLQQSRPDFQHLILAIMAELARIVPHKEALREAGALQGAIELLGHPSEDVQEKAAAVVWTLVIADTNKVAARELGALQGLIKLLGSSTNEAVLDHVAIALGYMTRDDRNKELVRELGGFPALIKLLEHPNEGIQTKASGALWNCASNAQNKVVIRELGGLATLIRLLSAKSAAPQPSIPPPAPGPPSCPPNEAVQENAAGALWNCAVDATNKTAIRELDGLPPLIALLRSTNEAVLENASGALWNCAAVGENRVALRKLGGLEPLVALLRSPNESVQENAAGAIRNCAINDQNKVAIRELGGLEVVVSLLEGARPSVLEKLVSTLWICSINPENKVAIQAAGGLPALVRLLTHPSQPIVEKALGTLRNCSTVAENKVALRECRALDALVSMLAAPALAPTIQEYAAATLWNCARCEENKAYLRQAKAIEGLVWTLSAENPSATPAVLENAAGALLSLSVNAENKDRIREVGGLHILAGLLANPSEYVLENALSALKNCAVSHENAIMLRDLGVVAAALPHLSSPHENVAKEAGLLLKNMALIDVIKPFMVWTRLGGWHLPLHCCLCSPPPPVLGVVLRLVGPPRARAGQQADCIESLARLTQHPSQGLAKIGAQVLQSLAKYPDNRRQIEQRAPQLAQSLPLPATSAPAPAAPSATATPAR